MPEARGPHARRVLGCGVAVAAIPLLFGLGAGDAASRSQGLIAGLLLAGLPYLYIWRHWRRLGDDRATFAAVLAIAALGRVALLAVPPVLSEDLWRYLWDGAVQWAGINPYIHAPNAAALDGLAVDPALGAVRAQIGHPHIATIYPPAAQLAFVVATVAGPLAGLMRALFVVVDVLAVAALWRWAARSGRRPAVAVLYAFAPLAMVESAVGAHVDVVGVAALVLAGLALAAGRPLRAGGAVAVAIGVKLAPVLVIPTLLRERPRAAVAAVVGAGVLLVPYLSAGEGLLSGLRAYGQRWRANDGLFAVLAWPFERLWPAGERPVAVPGWVAEGVRALVGPAPGAHPGEVWGDEVSFAAAKSLAGLIFGLFCLWVWWRARDFEGVVGPVLAALFLVSPVVHPWYLLWVLPFAALATERRAVWAAPVIVWSLLVPIAYLPRPEYLRSGVWQAEAAWAAVEYVPVWGLLLLNVFRARAPRAETRRCPSRP